MPVENAQYIHQLEPTYPLGSDDRRDGDNHIRNIKSAIKSTFPNVNGVINASSDELNLLVGLTGSVQSQLDALLVTIQNNIYPVGSIYTNATNSTNPAELLGFGTWEAFGEGRVLVGVDGADSSFNDLGETGGSKDSVLIEHTHTATTSNSGNHSHYVSRRLGWGENADNDSSQGQYLKYDYGSSQVYSGEAGDHNHDVTISTEGESGVNKNLQPYIVVKMWKRIA